MIYQGSKAVIAAHANGHRYSAWVNRTSDAVSRVKSSIRRNGPVRWAAVFDDSKLRIEKTSDWDAVSPDTNRIALIEDITAQVSEAKR